MTDSQYKAKIRKAKVILIGILLSSLIGFTMKLFLTLFT